MADTIRCDECGAAARGPEKGPNNGPEIGHGEDPRPERFCRYCGAAFRLPEPPQVVTVQESQADEKKRRFEELAAHPSTRRALRTQPSAAPAVAKQGGGLVLLLVLLGFAVVIAGFQCSVSNEVERGFQSFGRGMPPPGFNGLEVPGLDGGPGGSRGGFFALFKIIPVAIVGVILFQVLRRSMDTAEVIRSPTRSWLAYVADESSETRGHGDRRRSVTVLTLETESGTRRSYDVGPRLSRAVVENDMGVAHTRGRELIEFDRINV